MNVKGRGLVLFPLPLVILVSGLAGGRPSLLTASVARALLGGEKRVSLDLGLSEIEVKVEKNGFALPDGEIITASDLVAVTEKEGSVFFVDGGSVFQVAVSDRHYYKLVPTGGAPTLEIDGVRMHRTVGTTPEIDARAKLEALGVDGGRVLDTCGGLGYTALEALRRGGELVVSVERRPEVLRIAALNPWSEGFLSDPRLHLLVGDVGWVVGALPDGFFDFVVHDPPTFSHAGHLYGGEFHRRLFGLLRSGGGIFHYTGEPGSRFRRVDLRRGVMERLRGAGFRGVRFVEEALGVVGFRSGR